MRHEIAREVFPLIEQSVNPESDVISVSGKGIWVENLQVLKLQVDGVK